MALGARPLPLLFERYVEVCMRSSRDAAAAPHTHYKLEYSSSVHSCNTLLRNLQSLLL